MQIISGRLKKSVLLYLSWSSGKNKFYWKMYTGRKPEQVYLVVKMKKNRMERNLKKERKRYGSNPEVMLIWMWVKI